MDSQAKISEHFVRPDQLRIGLHIHLDLPWIDHPFAFPSFKIQSSDQIAAIQGLGLKTIRYSPAKSEGDPLAGGEADAPASPVVVRDKDPAYQVKQERMRRLAEQQARLKACEREFLGATRRMKAVRQNLFSRPDQVCKLASEGVDRLAESMLVETDLSLHLMSAKAGDDIFDHSLNVALLSMMIGKEMKLCADEIRLLGIGALLHDIGQADIPGHIKNKTTPLTQSEAALLRQHCAFGVTLGKQLGLPPEALLIIAQHHERADGSGYPQRLAGPQLSQLSRIVSMIEAYDELCNPRHAGRAFSPHEALASIYAQKGKQYDDATVTAFVRCLSVYPPGTIVLLSNGTLGMVTEVNSARLLKPVVMVYDAAIANSDAIIVDLADEPEVTISKAIRPQLLPPEVCQFFVSSKRLSYYFSAEAVTEAIV